MTVFFSAGEASGDAYAAELANAIRAKQPYAKFKGIGGPRSRAAGIEVLIDSTKWGAIGIIESLKVVPRVFSNYWMARKLLEKETGLFIPIDFGFVNVKLAQHAKKLGWKVLYFIPPGSWKRGPQGRDLPLATDAIVTPFPWSAEALNEAGANAHFFGHPLVEMTERSAGVSERKGIALLPGSRMHEIKYNLPVIAEAVKDLDEELCFGVAASLDPAELEKSWTDLGGKKANYFPSAAEALSHARAAIVCSGTATLEAALCRTPSVVIYVSSKAAEIEYKIRKPKFTWVSLTNILLNRTVVPELIQWDAKPEVVKELIVGLLDEGSEDRKYQLEAFDDLRDQFAGGEVFAQTAEIAAKLLEKSATV